MEKESWRRNHAETIMENHGGGIMEEAWRRNLGTGIMEKESWRRDNGEEFMEKES